jgi:hypothetical protein
MQAYDGYQFVFGDIPFKTIYDSLTDSLALWVDGGEQDDFVIRQIADGTEEADFEITAEDVEAGRSWLDYLAE